MRINKVEYIAEYKLKLLFGDKKTKIVDIEPLIKKYKELNIDSLPKAFVHGDIIATNVMQDTKGNLKIIDLAKK